jgi:putative nucleotidyltransferase with HDIG domain
MTRAVNNSVSWAGLADVCRLKAEFQDLGLTLTVWDTQGQLSQDFHRCAVGETLDLPVEQTVLILRQLAMAAIEKGEPIRGRSACGCCAIAIPLLHRRRITGAATVCFPVLDELAVSQFHAFSRRANLDCPTVSRLLGECNRYRLEDADRVERLSGLLIQRELAARVANEELGNLSANLVNSYEELSLLYRISGSMNVAAPPQDFIHNVCRDLLEVMNIESAAGVVSAHPPAILKDMVIISGDIDLNVDQVRMLSAMISPRLANQKDPVLENHFLAEESSGLGRTIKKFVAVPLLMEGRSIGMLVAINKTDRDFDSNDAKLLHSIANQASVLLTNHRLYADLQDLLMGVLHALTATIDAKDRYTCGHSQRVALLSKLLAQKAGLTPPEAHQVYLAGLLHDIGKIGVPEAVLQKEGRLTPEEYVLMKEHSALGAKILQDIHQLDGVIEGILTHHERPDGRGYPRGLSGSQVPLAGMIIGLADVFDAMTSDRTYRKALSLETALAEIKRCAGAQFDRRLVDLLMSFDFTALMEELRRCTTQRQDILSPQAKEVLK